MEKTFVLDYRSPGREDRRLGRGGFWSLIVGLSSGAVGFVLALTILNFEHDLEWAAVFTWEGCLVAGLWYCEVIAGRLARSKRYNRGKGLAIIGILAVCAWQLGGAIFVLSGGMQR